MHVSWNALHGSADPEVDASSGALPEYRGGSITIHGGFLDCSPAQRRLSIVHEILHLPLAPMVQEQEAALARLCPKDEAPRFHEHLGEQWRQRFEGSVQDLTYAVLLIPEDALPTVPFVEDEDEHPEPLDLRLRRGAA